MLPWEDTAKYTYFRPFAYELDLGAIPATETPPIPGPTQTAVLTFPQDSDFFWTALMGNVPLIGGSPYGGVAGVGLLATLTNGRTNRQYMTGPVPIAALFGGISDMLIIVPSSDPPWSSPQLSNAIIYAPFPAIIPEFEILYATQTLTAEIKNVDGVEWPSLNLTFHGIRAFLAPGAMQ